MDKALRDIIGRMHELDDAYCVTSGKGFKLAKFDPGDTGELGAEDKPRAKAAMAMVTRLLAEFQDKLYAQDSRAVLLILQGPDAAGKDSLIKKVLSGVNPQGCRVHSFKAPSEEELDHDYMWRCLKRLPERGMIGIFNRSYYEEVLAVRIHPELLQKQRLPETLVTRGIWRDRYRDIRRIERYLARNGVTIRKFFLNLSRAEQRRRFLERIDNPDKNWKFSLADARSRRHWNDYQRAAQDMIANTATPYAPWYVLPADRKWYTQIVAAAVIIETLASLGLHYPKVGAARRRELEAARRALLAEGRVGKKKRR